MEGATVPTLVEGPTETIQIMVEEMLDAVVAVVVEQEYYLKQNKREIEEVWGK